MRPNPSAHIAKGGGVRTGTDFIPFNPIAKANQGLDQASTVSTRDRFNRHLSNRLALHAAFRYRGKSRSVG